MNVQKVSIFERKKANKPQDFYFYVHDVMINTHHTESGKSIKRRIDRQLTSFIIPVACKKSFCKA